MIKPNSLTDEYKLLYKKALHINAVRKHLINKINSMADHELEKTQAILGKEGLIGSIIIEL